MLSSPGLSQHIAKLAGHRRSDLQPAESSGSLGSYGSHLGSYGSGALGSLHSLTPTVGSLHSYTPTVGSHYGMPVHGGSLGSSYDDLHKYGGIGKKTHTGSLYDHGSKGKSTLNGIPNLILKSNDFCESVKLSLLTRCYRRGGQHLVCICQTEHPFIIEPFKILLHCFRHSILRATRAARAPRPLSTSFSRASCI